MNHQIAKQRAEDLLHQAQAAEYLGNTTEHADTTRRGRDHLAD